MQFPSRPPPTIAQPQPEICTDYKMTQAMKTAAALSLASVFALIADPVFCFVPLTAPPATKHVEVQARRSCFNRPRRAADVETRMGVEGGDRKAVALETSDELPRGPAGAISVT